MTRSVLDLRDLPSQCEIHPEVAGAIALAASVVLVQNHGAKGEHEVRVDAGRPPMGALLVAREVDDVAARSYADFQEATEEGAEAVGILVVRQWHDRITFRRLPKGTGADYLLRHATGGGSDDFERLQLSGIGRGEETLEHRVREKVGQLRAGDDLRPGFAVVTDFRAGSLAVRCARVE